MEYDEQLQKREWKILRNKILKRDDICCQICKNLRHLENAEVVPFTVGYKYINGKKVTGLLPKIDRFNKTLTFLHHESVFLTSGIGMAIAGDNSIRLVLNHKDYPASKDNMKGKKWHLTFGVHIHHKYYQEGKMAWEYPIDALITVCEECHEDIHLNERIPWLDEDGKRKGELTTCDRCHGRGYFSEYSHVQNGTCFKCAGKRYLELMI